MSKHTKLWLPLAAATTLALQALPAQAAEVLRISTTTLWRRLKDFGIDGPGGARGRMDVRAT